MRRWPSFRQSAQQFEASMHSPFVEFKGGSFTLSTLRLGGHSLAQLEQSLSCHIERAPTLFRRMPVILDAEALGPELALSDVLDLLRRHDLMPMAITRAQAHHRAALESLPLPCLEHKGAPLNRRLPPLVIDRPVRSGQQVYAKERDLLVLGQVSEGAELAADGNIQLFGAMRGRAFAGASGETSACLICHQFQPELVALAGHYQMLDPDHGHWGQAVLVQLQGDALAFTPLPRS
ncbi:septum site-determining protein MinC [Ferrimonas balearica]|uniref:septum site-determining protein MinC n=1 Tax=Ferrimonas balearica TaxID=44012 RepID=UPI001C9A0C01|nr:septum site-determining protein MinC [Ferrimonas balearica]MBY5991420.1 septum site-determining protein MinC [Ferrimonas balearica]